MANRRLSSSSLEEEFQEDTPEPIDENVHEEARGNVHENFREEDNESVQEHIQKDFPEDFSSWIGSIASFVKDTRAKCLDLRAVPYGFFQSLAVDIQPIVDSLVGSEITELYLNPIEEMHNVQGVFDVLAKTKIEKLTTSSGLKADDILKLMAILRNTQVTELVLAGGTRLQNDEVDGFFYHLANSHVKYLKFYGLTVAPFEKIYLFSQILPDTQVTCLSIPSIFSFKNSALCEDREEILHAFLSNLQHTALTDLDIRCNDLDESSMVALAIGIRNSRLEKLNLVLNKIHDSGVDILVPGLVASKITHLNLGYNEINGNNSLGRYLKYTKIRALVLTGNPLPYGGMFSGPNFFRDVSLDVLKVGCRGPYETNPVPLPIRELRFSRLTGLDLTSDCLTVDQISAVAEVLSHSNITHIELWGNDFSKECYDILGDCLKRSVVKYIDLSSTASSDSIQGVNSFLEKTKGSTIVSVSLRNNKFGSDTGIVPALENTTFLELDLSDNAFSKCTMALAQQLKFTAITALYLHRNDIGDAAVSILAEHLQETQVVELDLGMNPITNQGATALALVFKKTKLRHLNLEFTHIEEDGLEILAEHALDSCITYLSAGQFTASKRKLLIDRSLWENRRKIQLFAGLLEQTGFFKYANNIFQFDQDFNIIDVGVFIENHLKFYKMVSDDPFVVNVIEQDKFILDRKRHYRSDFKPCANRDLEHMFQVFIKDCEVIYNNIVEHPSPVKDTAEQLGVSFFKKQIHWLLFEYYPIKFVSFVGEHIEADLETNVCLLKKIEDRGLSSLVEALLLNRPLYMIDNEQEILHPYVYQLLSKYKRTICNTDVEPEGLSKIIEYFQKHIDLVGASEVITLLSSRK